MRGIPLLPKYPLGLQKPIAVGNSPKMGVSIVGLFGQKHVQIITEKTVGLPNMNKIGKICNH